MPLGVTFTRLDGAQANPWTLALIERGGPGRWVGANLVVMALYVALGATVSRFFAAYGLFPAPI